MIEEFNSSNPCGITVDAQNQGSYDDIRDKVNASIAAGEAARRTRSSAIRTTRPSTS